jgi:hypothetical protein
MLTELKRMQLIGDEFPLPLVAPAVIAKVDAVALAVEKAVRAEPWVPVADRLPTAGCKVLVCYRNSYGRLRRTCAHYSPLHTVDASTWDEGEPDETEDGAFKPEGWWEEPVEIERVEFIADEVTHWMPLPEPPPLPGLAA